MNKNCFLKGVMVGKTLKARNNGAAAPTTASALSSAADYDKEGFLSGLAVGMCTCGVLRRPVAVTPEAAQYLTFESNDSFTIAVYDNAKHWDGTLEYSTDTNNWSVWDGTSAISSGEKGNKNVLYIRGTGNTVITGGNSDNYRWVLTGDDIRCVGNIENLLDWAMVASGEHPAMASYCYAYMFHKCTSLTQAPRLPATTLATYCYFDMFYGCTGLLTVPELPATDLSTGCYLMMFGLCKKIKLSASQTEEYTQAYRIPKEGAGTGGASTRFGMFNGTGGTFTGSPSLNTTYYLSSSNMIV